MDIREKLVEILDEVQDCGQAVTYSFETVTVSRTDNYGVADHLIANGVTVQEWVPVTERLPERGEFVLFYYAKNNRNPTLHAKNTMAVGRYDYGMFLADGCEVKVTHWMPLPQPPKGE